MGSGNQQQIRTIRVVVDAGNAKQELKGVTKELQSMNKSVKSISDDFGSMKNALYGILGTAIIGQFTSMADSMQLLGDRIKSLLGNQEDANYAFEKLKGIATETKAPIDDLAGTFARIAVAMKGTGLSVQGMLDLTKLLQNSFRLSGASTEEATASTIQFAQALSFGQLRGQELRSVLSQNATLANIFKKAIEGSGKDIYKFAEAGGFTSKFVLKALSENMAEINKNAGELGTTFSQSLTIATNELKVVMGDLNKEFGLSSKFANFVKFLIDNKDAVAAGIAGIAAGFVAVKIAAVGVAASLAAVVGVVFSIPTLIGLIVAGLTYMIINLDKTIEKFKLFGIAAYQTILEVADGLTLILTPLGKLLGTDFFEDIRKSLNDTIKGLEQMKTTVKGDIVDAGDQAFYDKMKQGLRAAGEATGGLKDDINKLKEAGKTLTIDEQLRNLNESFNAGRISVEKYNDSLLKLTRIKFEKNSPARLQKELDKVKIENLSRQFEDGKLSIEAYNKKLTELKIEQLTEKFKQGKIAASEFNSELLKLGQFSWGGAIYEGVDQYINKIGTLSTNVSNVISGALSHMEDSLVEFTKNGKFAFRDFAQAILDDINRMVIRMAIMRPLTNGLLSFLPTGPASGDYGLGTTSAGVSITEGGFAKGGAFRNGVQFFAQGGIVNSPTAFGMSGGIGVMGEAGSEAIMPLSRTASGDLGVKASTSPVIVNIVNQNNSEIEQKESTDSSGNKVLDVIIKTKVQESFTNGSMDKTMKNIYGLQRRGN